MTINLKQISIYQEAEPYDVDVDNRPLLDIQDNLVELTSILESQGCYQEIAADASLEPAGGFSIFTCACIYSNNLLIPITISKPISEIDYSKYPIVLILGYKEEIKKYSCISFSAGISLNSKFLPMGIKVGSKTATFAPGSEGRLLRVGPGGELVDQMYYDLAHASKGYQALYVGKILTTTSIVFGGNQVSILGNNFYLAKNRNDVTSGLTTIQRDNKYSNTIFKSLNIDSLSSDYVFAEFINSKAPYGSVVEAPVPVYFSSTQLPYNQGTGLFTTARVEDYLNDIHFKTPNLTVLSDINQSYKTAGVNVRSLFDFADAKLLHRSSYSNTIYELTQDISTKLIFVDRENLAGANIPIGIAISGKSKSVGTGISLTPNIPSDILPTEDNNGVTFGDYFGSGTGVYIGAVEDASVGVTRPTALNELTAQLNQTIPGTTIKSWTTSKISDYSDSFNLVIAAKSSTSSQSNIVLSADGFITLSAAKGVLLSCNWPTLDAEVVHKKFVDTVRIGLEAADNNRVPLAGTSTDPYLPVTGPITIDVTGDLNGSHTTLKFNAITQVSLESPVPIWFTDTSPTAPVSGLQLVKAYTTPWTIVTPSLSPSAPNNELTNKSFVFDFVFDQLSSFGGSSVPSAGPAVVDGVKTFTDTITSLISLTNDGSPNLRLSAHDSPKYIDFSMGGGQLTINNGGVTNTAILLGRESLSTDSDLAIATVGLVNSVAAGGLSLDKTKMDLSSVGTPSGTSKSGYVVLGGELVMYWCQTSNHPYPDSGAFDPYYTIDLPTGLFDKIYNISITLNNHDTTGNNFDDDVIPQLVGFDASNVTDFTVMLQGITTRYTNVSGFSFLVYIVGKKA